MAAGSATAPVHLLVNSGPLAKHNATITLPTGESSVAEKSNNNSMMHVLSTMFQRDSTTRPSAESLEEHFILSVNPASENLIVEDMGSTNHTYVDREQVIAGTSVEIGHHQMLVLAGKLYLIRPGQMPIIHTTTGVRLFFVGPQTLHPGSISSPAAIHLGRLQVDGSHEAFAKAIMQSMDDDAALDSDDFRRVSRRHATLTLNDGEYTLTVEEGKSATVARHGSTAPEATTVDSTRSETFPTGGASITLGKQTFRVE